MDYLSEAENGEKICLDELRVTDVVEFIRDLKQNEDDYPLALCRIYYAGYSMGYKDAMGMNESEKLADQGSGTLEIKD